MGRGGVGEDVVADQGGEMRGEAGGPDEVEVVPPARSGAAERGAAERERCGERGGERKRKKEIRWKYRSHRVR
jgi:hypothetical protein